MLEKIFTFETGLFDEGHNSNNTLCSRFINEASMAKSLVADLVLVQTASAVIITMVMGLVVAWKLALVMISI